MQRIRTGISAAVVALVVVSWATGPATAADVPDEIIVRFEGGLSAAERAAIRNEAGTAFERALPVDGMQLVDVAPGRSAVAAERALEGEDGVLYAEPNFIRRVSLRPNDPLFPQLWGMENTGQVVDPPGGRPPTVGSPDADTDAADAWDVAGGGGVVVAVIDTGVDINHPDLAPNAWRNPGESGSGRESNRVDDDRNGFVDDWRGWNFADNNANSADENGHGTHVAGTIGARRNNALGVAGVTDRSPLMPLRIFGAQGTGTVADAIEAYRYAAAKGARVLNLSFGSFQRSQAEQDTIAAFPGMLFVAAAGNGGLDDIGDDNDRTPEFPCAYALPNVVCVAASDNRDTLAGFSNFGARSVDLSAPGVAIASTWPGGRYAFLDGTSMATPHVAGAAALLWAAAPSASPSAIVSALLAGTDKRPAFTGVTVTGGRLNVLTSLRLLLGRPSASPPRPPVRPPPPPRVAPPPPVSPPAPPPSAGDRVPPQLSVRVGRRKSVRALLRRGLSVRLRCSEPCSVRLRLQVRRRVFAGAGPRSLPAGAGRRVVVRIRAARRARLRAAVPARATLVVRATDASGNARTVRLRIRLRR
jgi:thermitase